MGRRKIEIKAITHERTRSTTFTKRKNGLFKKAYELGVLCSVKIAVIVFEKRPGQEEKVFEYCSGDVPDLIHARLKFSGHIDTKGPKDFTGKSAAKLDLDGDDDDDDDDEVTIIKTEPETTQEIPASPPRKKPRVIAPYPSSAPSMSDPGASSADTRRATYPLSNSRYTPPPTPQQDPRSGPIQLPPLPFQISVTLPPNVSLPSSLPQSASNSFGAGPQGYPQRISDRSTFHGGHLQPNNPNANNAAALNLFDMLLRVASASGSTPSVSGGPNGGGGISFDIAPPPSSDASWVWPAAATSPPNSNQNQNQNHHHHQHPLLHQQHPTFPGGLNLAPAPGDEDWLGMLLSSGSSNEPPSTMPQEIPPGLTRMVPPAPPGYSPIEWENHLRSQSAALGRTTMPHPNLPSPSFIDHHSPPGTIKPPDNARMGESRGGGGGALGDDGTLPLLFSSL